MKRCLIVLSLTVLLLGFGFSNEVVSIATVPPLGQKIVGVAVEYDAVIDGEALKSSMFEVEALRVKQTGVKELKDRTVTNVYTNTDPALCNESKPGRFVIIELYPDDPNAGTYYWNGEYGINKDYAITNTVIQKEAVTAKDGTTIPANVYEQTKMKQLWVNNFQNLVYTNKDGKKMAYSLYLPEDYNPEKAYPIVMFLHGSGERGFDNQMHLKANKGALTWIESETQKKHPAIVLAPQCPVEEAWTQYYDDAKFELATPGEMAYDILQEVINEYSVNRNKVYVTGLSLGGFGTWALNIAHPDEFAATVPVCGGGDPEKAYLISENPVWAFHAADDSVVDVQYARDIITDLLQMGSNVKYTEYDRGVLSSILPMAHFAWVPAYENDEMIDWLFTQTK